MRTQLRSNSQAVSIAAPTLSARASVMEDSPEEESWLAASALRLDVEPQAFRIGFGKRRHGSPEIFQGPFAQPDLAMRGVDLTTGNDFLKRLGMVVFEFEEDETFPVGARVLGSVAFVRFPILLHRSTKPPGALALQGVNQTGHHLGRALARADFVLVDDESISWSGPAGLDLIVLDREACGRTHLVDGTCFPKICNSTPGKI